MILTPTFAEIQKAKAVVEYAAAEEAAVIAAAQMVCVAHSIQSMVSFGHYNTASQEVVDKALDYAAAYKRAAEAREALWATESALDAARAAETSKWAADNEEYEDARRSPEGADLSDDDLTPEALADLK